MKRFTLILAIIVYSAMGIFYSPMAFAYDPADKAGVVVAVRGDVTATDAKNRTRKLALKNEIYRQDTIRTGKRGRLQIMFTDNSIISLGKNSEMQVVSYEWDDAQKTGELKTQVKEGVFRVMGGAITREAPENFVTETPAAVIGIRGSMFTAMVKGNTLTVVFEGGKGIDVTNDHGSVALTRAGFGTRVVGRTHAPAAPIKFTVEAMAKMGVTDMDVQEEETDTKKQPKDKWVPHEDRDQESQKPLPPPTVENIKPKIIIPVDYAPVTELWEGFFSSVSTASTYTGTGEWAIPLDKKNGGILNAGFPVLGSDDGQNRRVLFLLGNIRGNSRVGFQADLHPQLGQGGGTLETADMALQDIRNAIWGWTDLVYQDDRLGRVDSLSFWINGRRTPGSKLTDLIARSITGRFRGSAHGFGISETELFYLHNGTTDLQINFGTQRLNGLIQFDEVTLNITGTDIFHLQTTGDPEASAPSRNETRLFWADITTEDPFNETDTIVKTGHATGMFFGDSAMSLGGNFDAEQNNIRYTGIFGGNREIIGNYTEMTGKFMGGLFKDESQSIFPTLTAQSWYGDVTAKVYESYIDGEMKGENNVNFSFRSYIPDLGLDITYLGPFSAPFQHQMVLGEAGETVDLSMRLFTSHLREFAILQSVEDSLVLNAYKFGELAFFGTPSQSVPTEGIARYEGLLQATTDTGKFADNDLILTMNWKTGKAVGIISEPGIVETMINSGNTSNTGTQEESPKYPLVFMVGDAENSGTVTGHVFGLGGGEDLKSESQEGDPAVIPSLPSAIDPNGEAPVNPEWINGTLNFGRIYGSNHQGIGMTGTGDLRNVAPTISAAETFRLIAAGFKSIVPQAASSDTGTSEWAGFAMGVSQDVDTFATQAATEPSFHILMVDDPASFTYTVNKDTGEIENGNFTVTNMDGENYDTYAFHFGENKTPSAWVNSRTMATELDNETQDGHGFIATDMAGMMIDSANAALLPDYVSWGYWGATYRDAHTDQTHVPLVDTCLWIGGEKTPQSKVQDLIAAERTGTYAGTALGITVDPQGMVSRLNNGQTSLSVNFGAQTVSGNISFDEVRFDLDSGAISDMGKISAMLSGTNVTYGQANGQFFGPDAAMAAGTFKADMADTTRHMGVFSAMGVTH